MKALYFHPLFGVGIAIRLALIAAMAPGAASVWYAPFMDVATSAFAPDPWGLWLESGGDAAAFPYGYAMWLALAPAMLAAKALSLPPLYGYALALFAADLCVLAVLRRSAPGKEQPLLAAWHLSPIILIATYVLGFNDIVAVLFLVLAIQLLREGRGAGAGVSLAVAISAKLSMVAALPLFAIYLLRSNAQQRNGFPFLRGFLAAAAALFVPFALSAGGPGMLFDNPEMENIYRLAIELDDSASVYILPAAYLVTLYLVWRVRRFDFDLFVATIGMVFLFIVLLSSNSAGWFVWVAPFLTIYRLGGSRADAALVGLFSAAWALSALLAEPLRFSTDREVRLGAVMNDILGVESISGYIVSLLHTGMVAVGAVLAIRICREAIMRSDFFRLSRKPFAIGIAGDSGSGKDHLAGALVSLFGARSVTWISGDDYHLWDRGKPMWRFVTHLNPLANDLERFGRDLVALVNGRAIRSRRYDHRRGKLGRPISVGSNDFIVASGLHALYSPASRECYDLKIYLDMDEELRRWFKLRRDVRQRGHSSESVMDSLARREPDSRRFVRPQKAHADVSLALRPVNGLEEPDGPPKPGKVGANGPRMRLTVRSKRGFDESSLARALISICGLAIGVSTTGDGAAETELTFDGEPGGEDIALAATALCPRLLPFLAAQPGWRPGVTGLMQLVVLCHMDQALTRRLL